MREIESNVQGHINRVEKIIITVVTDYQYTSGEELINYFDGPAPSGDTTTLSDILDNQWLLIHELIEISELKKMNLIISSQLLETHATEVEYAHITATEYEFRFAKEAKDYDWISSRMRDVNSWLEDKNMPLDLKARCKKLILEFSN